MPLSLLVGPSASSSHVPFRILYVDDNRDLADSAVELLRLAGFDARACYDGPTALAEAVAHHPTLCMIDLNMLGMDGDELAGRLQRVPLETRPVLIAVTAMSDAASADRIRAAGFDRHLVKPVDPLTLVALAEAYRDGTSSPEGCAEGSLGKLPRAS